jgi:uncharacterized alpha-E superfamily protein
MLSRVADALFWMSRYLERAEHVARLLDVCFHLELDLHGVLAGAHDTHWTKLASILQQPLPLAQQNGQPLAVILGHWLTFDLTNPNSIMTCISRARYNARSIRGTINSRAWKELNKLYWLLCDPAFSSQARESPHEFYEAVICGSFTLQGVCDTTMTHDEGWQFIQLGKHLERADKTLRILDAHAYLLARPANAGDMPLSSLQWAGVLRCCQALEAYQKLYVGRVEPESIVDFLLLNASFARSVRFCLEAASQALTAIESPAAGRGLTKPDRILGRVLNDLKFSEAEQLIAQDLHAFLGNVMEGCAHVSRAVQDQYALR